MHDFKLTTLQGPLLVKSEMVALGTFYSSHWFLEPLLLVA
jgi:hypothetical protein